MKLTGSFVFDKFEVVFIHSQVSANENEKEQVISKRMKQFLLLSTLN
jgi:hypothetical protein